MDEHFIDRRVDTVDPSPSHDFAVQCFDLRTFTGADVLKHRRIVSGGIGNQSPKEHIDVVNGLLPE